MDDFKVLYRILRVIYDAMEYDEFDYNAISPEVLGVSKRKRDALLMMLVDKGYIKGVQAMTVLSGDIVFSFEKHPMLTLDGLEYMHENSTLQKAARAAKGIADIIS